MNRRTLVIGAVALAAGPQPGVAVATDPASVIAAVDRFRLPSGPATDVKITSRITEETGSNRGSDRATVFTHKDDSLVLLLDGERKGMKVLQTAKGFWLYAPRTRRAMRLTPMQTLRGQASMGDIARLRLAEDYSVQFGEPDTVQIGGRACWVLKLSAKSATATYAKIVLRAAKSDGAPVEAELMAQSGRLLKKVLFAPPTLMWGRRMVATTTYIDGIDPTKRTTVQVLAVEPSTAPASWFRPEALPLDF